MTQRLLLLIGATLAVWVLAAIPARSVWGDLAAVCSGVAALLCLIPAAISLAWAGWAYNQPVDKQMTMVLGGTGLRLFAVAGGAYALYEFVPVLRQHETPGFWTWVLLFYLLTLVLETTLSLASRPADRQPVPAAPAAPSDRVG